MNDAIETRPVGRALPDWQVPVRPGPAVMQGQYVRLDVLDPAGHGPALFDALGTVEDVWTYLPMPAFADADDLIAHLGDVTADPAKHVFYAITPEGCDAPQGFFSYYTIQPEAGAIELGYVTLGPALQRTRAATEATFLMIDWAFQVGYRRFEWKCDALNAPSRRAAARYGFTFEGIFRQATVVKGRNRDTAWFSIIDSEWPDRRAAFTRWLAPENFDASAQQRMPLRMG
ncbi:MAG: GNAT family protein [Pseudomonadota bacterium]